MLFVVCRRPEGFLESIRRVSALGHALATWLTAVAPHLQTTGLQTAAS
jgi:hypothetical protein